MLDAKAIDAIDCETFKVDILQRKNLLHAVRAYFTESAFTGWDPTCSDADLFIFARATYKVRPIDDQESRQAALEDYEAWVLLAKVPFYICSYYKELQRKRLTQLAA